MQRGVLADGPDLHNEENVHVGRDHAGREKRVSPVRPRRGLQGRQCKKLNGYNIGRAQIIYFLAVLLQTLYSMCGLHKL